MLLQDVFPAGLPTFPYRMTTGRSLLLVPREQGNSPYRGPGLTRPAASGADYSIVGLRSARIITESSTSSTGSIRGCARPARGRGPTSLPAGQDPGTLMGKLSPLHWPWTLGRAARGRRP